MGQRAIFSAVAAFPYASLLSAPSRERTSGSQGGSFAAALRRISGTDKILRLSPDLPIILEVIEYSAVLTCLPAGRPACAACLLMGKQGGPWALLDGKVKPSRKKRLDNYIL